MSIYETLVSYGKGRRYPMHMPGHKRNKIFQMTNPYSLDVTEVDGMDDLHRPQGMIRELMDRIKAVYRTEESYVLVNGSTCGILAAISACCKRGDTILMDRSCHRSVYHAVYLLELRPVYLYRKQDSAAGISLDIDPEQVSEALKKNDVACVVLTSPTYEGVVSDIESIAKITHKKDIPLIVDEAHGAHFVWDEKMPETAVTQGADLVVESLHKTLPALTQTALLHLGTKRIPKEIVERYLDIYETSSPSYLLLAGVDQCIHWILEEGKGAFSQYHIWLEEFEQGAKKWRTLKLWRHPKQEASKLVILTGTRHFTGGELAEILRKKYQIEVEMETGNYVLAMTSVADTKEGFSRLLSALTEIDTGLVERMKENGQQEETVSFPTICPVYRMSAYKAMNGPYEGVGLAEGEGKISAEYGFFYPPGIPFIVPGEEITKEVLSYIFAERKKGRTVFGLADKEGEKIRIVVQSRMEGKNG
ncbi:MAG: aminotransferase class I/II-fold pyridoxal phosphate-dependent enzyme [Lachnospiraceae bacterium]|nr:aminotransferase class I/II-fold pyridoxal phosphate-dependent enzyme [Lachnospiraceae bacterium]